MIAAVVLLTFITLIYLITTVYVKRYNYWKKRNVLGPKPLPFVGNFGPVIITADSITLCAKKLYSHYSNEPAVGIYQGSTPMLILRDPDLIKEVLIKNFQYFSDRGTRVSNDILSDNLFNAEVDSWRKLRHAFTPMFSSGKLKSMSPLIQTCVSEFQTYVDKVIEQDNPHEMRGLMAKYTLEVIGSCAFGLKLGALTQEDNVFRDVAETIFKPRLKSTILRGLDAIFPGIIKFLHIGITSPGLTKFFQDLVARVLLERNDKSTSRKDFMDHLIELRNREHNAGQDTEHDALSLKITNDVMAAQALVFYAAGFETSSTAMSFLLYELALNQECQDKVYNDIVDSIKKHGGISYDAVCDMTYLDMAFDEILRKHPPAGVMIRRCVNDYTFSKTKLKINKDTKILIPVYGLHHDPQYFENPDEFNPERFSSENKQKIYPCTYIPFGEGPRNCIGMRFAKIESMMGLAGFLHKYKVKPSYRTVSPLVYETRSITMKSKHGLWLNVKRR